ncbi:HAMP domain-containing sensor histidine kinase [Oleiagrimonas sp. C23AA]|uniref:sensor histidine kinase n=1 Tax=Oleiagrimonas sp. C23AA TaxID=2719047 RepID=UPI001423E4B9|nr:HAMP domain-containing sensor histidine kinase [Oleiagrimonas sp. C23AA]NII09842.1 HAMP domain-containing histidine kinase [Oleiagrimonas sp. C23AA]
MRSRRRLRFRVTLSFALFGLALSVLFAVSAMYVRSKVENQLVTSALQNDVDQAVEKVHAHPDRPVSSELLQAWMKSERTLYKMPLAWQHLKSGVHDIHEVGDDGKVHHYKLAVQRKYGIIGFIRYDVTRDELGKRQLLIALIGAVLLFSALSWMFGRWLSGRVMRPVTDLAARLRGFRKQGKAEPLAPHFADDEVGELAVALDEYAARLTALVERDREFNSDVSHELRTPLAVIASTTELLQSSPDLTDKLRERLKRIERASRQATEMIEALLLLSRAERRGPTFGEITDAAKSAADVVESQRPQLRGKPIEFNVKVMHPLKVDAPASVLAVVLTNLIGNAVKYTQEGEVTVCVLDDRIVVEDTGPGIDAEQAEKLFQRGVRGDGAGGSGAGLGLAIVRRLCDLYGWGISLAPREDVRGAVAVLQFPPAR